MCGVAAVWNILNAGETTATAMHALTNRGRDGWGIAVVQDGRLVVRGESGTVTESLKPEDMYAFLGSRRAVGHVRYSTVLEGIASDRKNIQPIVGTWKEKWVAIAHNGNFTNKEELQENILKGVPLETDMDTEILLPLIAKAPYDDLVKCIDWAVSFVEGPCTMVVLTVDELIVVQDYSDNRPLSIGESGNGFAVASEDSALHAVGIYHTRDVEAGTVTRISDAGVETQSLTRSRKTPPRKVCPFEWVYFSGHGSKVKGVEVYPFRVSLGMQLAREYPVPHADIVIPIPDSGNFYAEGYIAESRRRSAGPGIVRNHYAGRSFVAKTRELRHLTIARKHSFNPHVVAGKVVVCVDDSIVRGDTGEYVVQGLLKAGAREVHFLSGYPPYRYGCRSGIDTGAPDEKLIARTHAPSEIAEAWGATTVGYISQEGYLKVVEEYGLPREEACLACIDGKYWH